MKKLTSITLGISISVFVGLINTARVRNRLFNSVGDKSFTFSPFKCVIMVPTWIEDSWLALTTVLLVFLFFLAVKPWNPKSDFSSCIILGITHQYETVKLRSHNRLHDLPLLPVCLGFCGSYSRLERLTLKNSKQHTLICMYSTYRS